MADDSLQSVYLDSDFFFINLSLGTQVPLQLRSRTYTLKDF